MSARRSAALAAVAALLLSAGRASADEEPAPQRRKGLYLALIFGGGLLDAGALYDTASIEALGNGSIGTFEGLVRGGYRTSLGLSPIVEGRSALIFGTLSGNLAASFSALGGVQYTPFVDSLRAPYLNLRAGVRSDAGRTHKTVAAGLGIELGRGQPFTLVELNVEPIVPWLVTLRVGAVF